MDNTLAVIDSAKIEKLDKVATDYALADSTKSPFGATFTLAVSMGQMRELLTPDVMKPIMGLMNSPLGFLTDKDPTRQKGDDGKPVVPYSEDVIRDVLIEATLRGFYPAGNEFNVIAGRFYAAKAGIRRKVTTWKGITDFKDFYEVPRTVGDGSGALVKARAEWKLNGTADTLEREFAIRVNKGMGADAISGKAERKLLKAVLDRISGIITPDGEIDETATASEAAKCAAAKPIFEQVPNNAPAATAPKPETAAPAASVQQPAPAPVTTPKQEKQPAADGPFNEPELTPLQQVIDWCMGQGITAHELCAVLRAENVIGARTHEFKQLEDKATALDYVLSHKEEIMKGVQFFRNANKQ